MTQEELIERAQICGWELIGYESGINPILIKGKFELWIEGDICNILENDGDVGYGKGTMYLSKAKPNANPKIIGLFGPIVGRWFSLEDCVFLQNWHRELI